MSARAKHSRVMLEVFVSAHCWHCLEARALAQTMQNEFAGLEVRVIDLDQTGVEKPASVFAVPTFLIDDQIIALGTPTRERLRRRIRRAFVKRCDE